MSLLNVIADHASTVYVVCTLGFVLSGGYALWKTVFAGASNEAPPAPSRATPRKPMQPLTPKPKSLEIGEKEHHARGEAKTVKVAPISTGSGSGASPAIASAPATAPTVVPAAKPAAPASSIDDDDDAKDALFGGLDPTPASPAISSTELKAGRMEQIGFHPQAMPTRVSEAAIPGIPADEDSKTELLTVPKDAVAAAGAAKVLPRTQTQELDDILSRIDKVLAENPVMATTTLGSASNDEAASVVKPANDQKKDSEGQQRLF